MRFARWLARLAWLWTMGATCTSRAMRTVVAHRIIVDDCTAVCLPHGAWFDRGIVRFPSTSASLTKTPGMGRGGSTLGMWRGVAWRRPGTYVGGRSRFCTSNTPPIEWRRRSVWIGLIIVDVTLICIGRVRFEETWAKWSFLAFLFRVFSCE